MSTRIDLYLVLRMPKGPVLRDVPARIEDVTFDRWDLRELGGREFAVWAGWIEHCDSRDTEAGRRKLRPGGCVGGKKKVILVELGCF